MGHAALHARTHGMHVSLALHRTLWFVCSINARHSNLINPCFCALGSGCALPTEISTANLVGLGIYGEASSVTDTTVPLFHITSVMSSQGRTRPSLARSDYSLDCFIRAAVSVVACTIDKTRRLHPRIWAALRPQGTSFRDWCRIMSRRERMQGVMLVMASPITALCDSRGRVCDLHEEKEPHVLIKFIRGVCS